MALPAITILLIEDDEEDYILLKKHLSRITDARYELLWEDSYEQGISRLLEGQLDLCLLDYQLGAHNGIELIVKARQQGSTLPIILLTGASSSELDIQALKAGADDYIDKSQLQGELLHRIIRYAIERKKAEQEREQLLAEQLLMKERYQAEQQRLSLLEALTFERTRFEEVLRHLPSGVMIADAPSGKIVDGNPQAEEMLRHPIHYLASVAEYREWVGWHLDGRPMQPEEWPLARAVHGEYCSEEVKYQRGDGTICFIRINGAPIKGLSGHVVAGVVSFNDTTEQKELEQQREIFVSMATHELKTPLTALQGNIQLAQRRLRSILSKQDTPPAEFQKQLDEVLRMLGRGEQQLRIQNRLINDMLEVSRLHENAFNLQLSECDLLTLVQETVQDFEIAHPQHPITLETAEQESLPVHIDDDRIRQVLNNYLTNAHKYSPTQAPIEVGLKREQDQVRVWVHDGGPGLSAEAQEHIWQRFYQVPEIAVQNKSGTGLGLGLYICQRLISKHGGQVGVASQPSQGATFWFTLPLGGEEQELITDEEHEKA